MAIDIGMVASHQEMGVLMPGMGDVVGSCGGNGNEVAFLWTVPGNGLYVIDTFGSDFDTVLYAIDGASCLDPEIDCSDDAIAGQSEIVLNPLVAGQQIYITLDSANPMSGGNYVLNITDDP